jgi:hypothetical protein
MNKNTPLENGTFGDNEFKKKNIAYKAPEGKLIKLKAAISNSEIKTIKITGDFFIHPEESITEIESFLINKKINQVEKEFSDFLNKKNIRIIGFKPKDLVEALKK